MAGGGANSEHGEFAAGADAKPRKEASVAVLNKAFAILDVLSRSREATTAEIAQFLGEPRSSVYRLLNTLVSLDAVEPGNHRGTYRLGLKLLQLGSTVLSRLDLRTAAQTPMRELHDATGETIFLCLRRGRDAVCIERIDGTRAANMVLMLGGSLPLHVGAAPRALLAFERRSEWDAYVSGGPLLDFLSGEELNPAQVIGQLEEVRRTGVALSDEDLLPGFVALGMPIFDHRGQVCASLSVSGLSEEILGSDLARERLRATAMQISAAIGYDGGRLEAVA